MALRDWLAIAALLPRAMAKLPEVRRQVIALKWSARERSPKSCCRDWQRPQLFSIDIAP
jgi:hypothetical protein